MVNLKICFFNDADHFNDTGTFYLGPEGLLVGVKRTPVLEWGTWVPALLMLLARQVALKQVT